MKPTLLIPTLVAAAAASLSPLSWAVTPVAGGTTTVGITVTEATQLAAGWSVKKSLMGKTVYNDAGDKVGKVEDLIISPDRNLSYVIVGAGGFIGIGRHDVAIPVSQIQAQGGKIVMSGATKDAVKAMPEFVYATDTTRRDEFVARADQDLAKASVRLTEMQKKADAATAEIKSKIGVQMTGLKMEVKAVEGKLADMKRAGLKHWREYEGDVNSATARLRKAVEADIA
jgi:sporulation protein YlmC with PRC-barrel domain